jgi:hypothetical protein
VLKDGVGEGDVDRVVSEREIPGVGHHVGDFHLELVSDAQGGEPRLERRVDGDRSVAHLGRSKAPPAPVCADVQEHPPSSRWQPEVRDRIARKATQKRCVQVAAAADDLRLYKGVDGASVRRRLDGWNTASHEIEGPGEIAVGRDRVRPEQDRNPGHHGIASPKR